jgi:SAM-dependent methyltransferases related to tRNA (uracil-5-)-methyltransferase
MAERFTIEKLGVRGDGISKDGNSQIFISGALPGETVLAERDGARANLVEIIKPSAERIEPFCPYYSECGGCSAQHMAPAFYRQWKRDIVVNALHHAGLETDIAPLENAHGEGRRRVTLHVRNRNGKVESGFMAQRSHSLVAIDHCPVTVKALHDAPAVARQIGVTLGPQSKPVSIQFTATENGLDIDIRGHGDADETLRQALIRQADDLDLARIAIHGDILVERKPPSVKMGDTDVVPPAGGFLQATEKGEALLSQHVLAFCEKSKRIADLFAGCGPFSLRLASKADIHAVEFDRNSMLALDRAARNAQGLRKITTETRDLFRRPLLKPELERFDAIVLDPPRAGAEAQSRQIALSTVGRVVSVSCDAGTFARDAAILIAGGYVLEQVIPVDQFAYSAHVEMVALFTRPVSGAKRKRRY